MSGRLYKSHASALLVAIGRYDDPGYKSLNEAPAAARVLAEALANGGYTHAHPELLEGETTRPSLRRLTDGWGLLAKAAPSSFTGRVTVSPMLKAFISSPKTLLLALN